MLHAAALEQVGSTRTAFSADDVRDIAAAASHITIHGQRGGEGVQKMIDR